jgi:hypothetical protein
VAPYYPQAKFDIPLPPFVQVEMQKKELIQGIPFWVDGQSRVYAFENKETPGTLHIGTYNAQAKTLQLRDDWKEVYEPRLQEYRRGLQARARVPPS